jgi:hypothetical protein
MERYEIKKHGVVEFLENSLKRQEITAQTEPSKVVPLPPSSWQWS